ncbi:hypothetical protein L2E82_04770 [Cichorium intybus]|uniref:Uncharacterized protein n=1 Tax=Cichorium intybus TaxID=13427 RepID=A0ACB9H739_CICIN|nr:hypothetical protein L2E82_04770 [Cichorium intybus]
MKDPGAPLISVDLGDVHIKKALLDLGASGFIVSRNSQTLRLQTSTLHSSDFDSLLKSLFVNRQLGFDSTGFVLIPLVYSGRDQFLKFLIYILSSTLFFFSMTKPGGMALAAVNHHMITSVLLIQQEVNQEVNQVNVF